jgi:DNA-binding NarL/FixJ family response regulator
VTPEIPAGRRTPAGTRLVLLDPCRAVGGALAAALDTRPALRVEAVTAAEHEARRALIARDADLLLLLDGRPRQGGFDGTASRLRAVRADLRVVVVTDADDVDLAVAAVRGGVAAWIPPSAGLERLVDVLADVMMGGSWFPPRLLTGMLDALASPRSGPEALALGTLTARERQVLACLVDGLDRRRIAEVLVLSTNTVRTHVRNVLRKLDVHSSVEAVALAIRAGTISGPDLP